MKISKAIIRNGIMKQPIAVELDAIIEKMGSSKLLEVKEPAQLLFSATFGRSGFGEMRDMTGLLALHAVSDDRQQVRQWLQDVTQVPYTLLAYRSTDRRELFVVVRLAAADGRKPQDADSYLCLLRSAQQQAAAIYRAMAGCPLDSRDISIETGCPMCYDPQLVYRSAAQPMPVVVKDRVQETDVCMYDDGSISNAPDDVDRQRMQLEYLTCLRQTVESATDENDHEALLTTLANNCRQAHLEEEFCVKRTLRQWRFAGEDDLVRKVFRASFATPYKGKTVSPMNRKELIARTIRDFFNRRYQLRFNEVKQVVEFRPNDGSYQPWQPLGDRELKRIAFEEMLEGGEGWMIDIELYVHSSFVRCYNPIREFLDHVGEWDGKRNYIEEYACRLKTDYSRWPHFFHRWLLAMVAQALGMNRDYGNSMVPLLIGPQAMKKSTFCKNILPYALREYYMDDIKLDNAEQVERVLGRMWLVNIDEYNSKTEREQAKIKRLLTEKDVQVRKMRSDQYTMTQRLCSFIATTNDRHPLCDPTGSRRYLCVEMTGQADMSGSINYRQMYAQAVWELEHGAQYWFDNDDEREIVSHNVQYQMVSSLEDALSSIFQPAQHKKEHFMTATDIQQLLRSRLSAADVPTLAKLGRSLKGMNYPEGAQDGIRGYYLRLRRPSESAKKDEKKPKV